MISILTLLQRFFFPLTNYLALAVVLGAGFAVLQLLAKWHKKRQYSTIVNNHRQVLKVSVVIAAHNESAVIENTINTLLKLSYPDFELWVVNDRSTDGTEGILDAINARGIVRFNCHHRPMGSVPGKAAALNEIAGKLTGDILCVFDADGLVEPDFLEKMIGYFDDPAVGAVQARKTLLNPRQNWLTKCQQYEYALDGCIQSKRDAIHGAVELRGNGMLLRTQMIQSLGGWNEQSLTEDLDLTTRMHLAGWDIRYLPDVQVWEEALPVFKPLLRQRIRWTEGSVIRYFEHLQALMAKRTVSFRAKLDMCQFIFEFVAPAWLLFENIMVCLRCPNIHHQVPSALSPAALLVLSLYFVWHLYHGVRRFVHAGFFQAVIGTLAGYLYLSFIWLPIVFTLIPRILLSRQRNLHWAKRPRYGVLLNDAG